MQHPPASPFALPPWRRATLAHPGQADFYAVGLPLCDPASRTAAGLLHGVELQTVGGQVCFCDGVG